MSKRAIVALGVVAALLLGYVLAFERTSITSKELSERKARVLPSFVREKVDRLELERQGQRVVLEKKPNEEGELRGWRLLAPVASEADEDVVDRVLGELEWLSARRTLDALTPEDAKRFGLAAPRYRVTYGTAGSRHVLEVGNEDVHADGVYVRVDRAARAHVVPKTLVDALKHEPGDFRDKQLLAALTVAWVQKLVVTRGDGKSELDKQADRWWLGSEPRGFADGKRVDELLHALADLRAARYVEPSGLPAAHEGLRSPTLRLDVNVQPEASREDQKARALGLEVGGACAGREGELYARALPDGPPVCVRADALQPLSASDSELRELRLFATDTSAIERFELAQGASKLGAQRAGESWKGQGTESLDRDAVEGWLSDLAAARATRVAPLAAFSEQGSLTLTLVGAKRERIAFSALDARGELVVKRGDEPLLVSFPASVFDRLQPLNGRFAALEPWSQHQPSEVQRVEARDEGRVRTLHLDGGRWLAPDGGADHERSRALVRRLVDLRVHAFVSGEPRPWHGITGSATRVVLTLASGRTLSLELGAPTAIGAYARLDGQRVVEIERDVVGIVRELAGGAPAPLEAVAPAADKADPAALEEHDEHDEGHEH